MLIGDLLGRSAARAPGSIAIVCGERRMTYRQLDEDANRLAHALIALGLGHGHAIAILSNNRPEYATVYFGAARSGAVLAHLSYRATADDLVYMLDRTAVEAVLVHPDYLDSVLRIRGRLPRLRHVIVLSGDVATDDALVRLEDLLTGQPATPPEVAIEESEPFAMTFTGGTTGLPKAVLVSHRARVASAVAGAVDFGLDERDTVAVTTPLFHSAGLFVWFQTAIALGATCVFLPTWDVAEFIGMVEGQRVTAAFMVPTQLSNLIAGEDFAVDRLATLRKINFAGAPMPPALFRRLMSVMPHVAFTEHYGQSEACPLTVRPPWRNADKAETVGRPCFGVSVAVVDDDGRFLPPGEPGHVVTRGDHLLTEYYGLPEQTADLYKRRDGWLLTGDVGVFDEDGFLSLIDRSKDMIISGGENIYPTEIENALYLHEAVAECAVFGIPDDKWGEVPAAHVVLQDGFSATEQDLIDHCLTCLARYKRPRLVKFVDSLPKTSVGKVQKNRLREPYWEKRGRKI